MRLFFTRLGALFGLARRLVTDDAFGRTYDKNGALFAPNGNGYRTNRHCNFGDVAKIPRQNAVGEFLPNKIIAASILQIS